MIEVGGVIGGITLLALGITAVFFAGAIGGKGIGKRERRKEEERKKSDSTFLLGMGAIILLIAILFLIPGFLSLIELRGTPMPVDEDEEIEGTVLPYQVIKNKLIFFQVKDEKIIFRLVDWERFHPVEQKKIFFPDDLKSYVFVVTPHGIEVREEVRETQKP